MTQHHLKNLNNKKTQICGIDFQIQQQSHVLDGALGTPKNKYNKNIHH